MNKILLAVVATKFTSQFVLKSAGKQLFLMQYLSGHRLVECTEKCIFVNRKGFLFYIIIPIDK